MLPLFHDSPCDRFIQPAANRSHDAGWVVLLGEMVRAVQDDGTMLREKLLHTRQPAHFDDASGVAEDQQGWHPLLRSSRLSEARRGSVAGGTDRCRESLQALFQVDQVVIALGCTLKVEV